MDAREFIVVEILSDEEIIVNYGLEDGAVKGQSIRVYEVGPMITNPDTGEQLGTYDYIKEHLEVYLAYEHFSVCKKIIRVNRSSLSVTISMMSSIVNGSGEVAKLNVNPEEITSRIPNKDKQINVKDKVKVIG